MNNWNFPLEFNLISCGVFFIFLNFFFIFLIFFYFHRIFRFSRHFFFCFHMFITVKICSAKVKPQLDWCQFLFCLFKHNFKEANGTYKWYWLNKNFKVNTQQTSKGNIQVCLNILRMVVFFFMCIAPLEVSNIHNSLIFLALYFDIHCTVSTKQIFSMIRTQSSALWFELLSFFCNDSIETLVLIFRKFGTKHKIME